MIYNPDDLKKIHIREDERQKVKDIPMEQILSLYGVERSANGKYHCPFGLHSDRHASLSVNTRNNYCKCFACGEGGDPISFVRKMDGISFVEAVLKFEDSFGIVGYHEDELKEDNGVNVKVLPFTESELKWMGFNPYNTIYEHTSKSLDRLSEYEEDLRENYDYFVSSFVNGRDKETLVKEEVAKYEQEVLKEYGNCTRLSIYEDYRENPEFILDMIGERLQSYKEDLCNLPKTEENGIKLEKVAFFQEKIDKIVHNDNYQEWIQSLYPEKDENDSMDER